MFINENFMLKNETARKLYKNFAKELPIIDYHCHISPKMIAEDYKFKNITELFLGGDHYKWRVMRSNGIDEKYITGDATDYEKFLKFAETIPYTIGNPMYHWTHLELKRYFDIDEPLSSKNADAVWNKCNEMLSRDDMGAKGLIRKSNVEVICTTDDPADTLEYHKKIQEECFEVAVYPTFRPDKAVEICKDTFLPYMEQIGAKTLNDVLNFLTDRIEYFASVGCRLSDHALEYIPYAEGDASEVFNKAINKKDISAKEEQIYKTTVLQHCAKEYAKRGWAMQLHIGALRNNNTKMYKKLGADTGFDSIDDPSIAKPLSRFLDSLAVCDMLPKTILYNLNPKDNYVLGTMLGNFQEAPVKSKIQFGSGWWFNDQRDGMEAQLKTLANLGLLARFVGMLTDSRSFVSYTRHEYFRRILCNLIGEWVENGEYPNDFDTLGEIVSGICYKNAKEYFMF